jgi:hypothetical protein
LRWGWSSWASHLWAEPDRTDNTGLDTFDPHGYPRSIDTETVYTDSTKMTVVATTVNTWSLATATTSTAWFCANSVVTPVSGSPSNESDCYQIDQSGNVLALKATVTINGVSVTLQ